MIKFSYIISNPPYGRSKEGLLKNIILKCKEMSNIMFTLGPTEYFITYEKYIGGVTERIDLNKEEYFKQVSNEISLIKIDCNSNINLNLFPKINKNPNYNPIYSPIPKLKIEGKEVDMSLAGIWVACSGQLISKEEVKKYLYKTKQNEDDIEVYTSTGTIKYTNSNYFLEELKKQEYNKHNCYNSNKIIFTVHSKNFKNLLYVDKNTHYLPYFFKKLIIKDKEEGEKLIKYLQQENLENIIGDSSINKSTLSHIPLPLFLVPPDHQYQHFNNYFKVTENTTLDYNNPDTYIIDLEKLKQ